VPGVRGRFLSPVVEEARRAQLGLGRLVQHHPPTRTYRRAAIVFRARVLEKPACAHACVLQVHHIVPLPTPLIRPEKKVCGSLTACLDVDLILFH
jgi:hypothetical protein